MAKAKQAGPVLIDLGGDMTIPRASAHRESLLAAYRAGGDAVVRMSQSGEADLSIVQLLCAAHHTFVTGGRSLVIEGQVPGRVRQVLDEAGITTCSCGRNVKECLWKPEGA
jgi:anti-anti-sigma regulatory factor